MKYILAYLAINLFVILSMEQICNIKIKKKSFRFFFVYLLFSLLLALNFDYSTPFVRVVLNLFIHILEARTIFKIELKESMIVGILIIVLLAISEIIYALVAQIFISLILFSETSPIFVFINNTLIGLVMFALCLKVNINKIYESIMSSIDRISEKSLSIFSLMIMVFYTAIGWVSYFIGNRRGPLSFVVYIMTLICIYCSLFVLQYLKTQNKYMAVSEKYDESLVNIKTYQEMIEFDSMRNHEVNNQFRTIRNMSKNKKIQKYIDALLDDPLFNDENIKKDACEIPYNGIQGIIYSKLMKMSKSNIKYELYVDRKIKCNIKSKLDDEMTVAICRILGVFLDNAIEYVVTSEDKNILIEFYFEDNNLCISISNLFSGFIDFNKISKSGYTTKEKGHGYGLALVEEIVKRNKNLEHEINITGNVFTQKLKIKM